VQDTDPSSSTSQAARLVDWIRLAGMPGVGPVTVQRLLRQFDHPQHIFSASYEALAAIVPASLARALCAAAAPDAAYLDKVQRWLDVPGHHVLTLDEPAYPPLLRQIPDPPMLLYVCGSLALLSQPSVAVVGSRNASLQGAANATAFAHALSCAGLGIVSGLALGIDAAAHEGGLRGPGSSIAVVGTGADRIYPRANRELAHRIASEGCMLSEYSLGQGPRPGNFPRRNRIISGLACAVLVVEAAAESGSLITAHLAAEQGRDVFAIPGSIHSPLSKGCHKLIKNGAKLVESAADLLEELERAPLAGFAPASAPEIDPEHRALLQAMGHEPLDGDAMASLGGGDLGQLAAQLLALELAGHIERLPGGFFQRIEL
jgi:DNA processing protein